MESTLYSITIDDLRYHIFTKLPEHIGDVEVTITDANHSYNGQVTKDEIIVLADNVEKGYSEYYQLMKECFCGNEKNLVRNKFAYQLQESDDSSFKFTWKQRMNDGGILLQLGSMKLHRNCDTPKVLTEILDSAMNQLTALKVDVSKLRSANEQLEKDKQYMVEKLSEYANAKDSLEKDLYTKFLLVLNQKKSRIRDLKGMVDSKSGFPSKTSKENIQQIKIDESLNDDEDLDTDEEKEIKQTIGLKETSKPSSSATVIDPLFNDVSHDDDDDDRPRKSRKRMKSNRPRTPVIPRTSSLPRPLEIANEEKASSMVKRKSNDLSADDLLAEI